MNYKLALGEGILIYIFFNFRLCSWFLIPRSKITLACIYPLKLDVTCTLSKKYPLNLDRIGKLSCEMQRQSQYLYIHQT